MIKLLIGAVLFSLAVSSPLGAQTPPAPAPQPPAAPPATERAEGARTVAAATPPLGGLGRHVSGVAPEHPLLHGRHFGDCVSEMAVTGTCPMDMEGE